MDAQQVIGPPKRVRSHTRKQAIWDFEPGKRLTVTFDAGQPIGKEAKELTSFLGTVAKMSQHIDISITDWRKVSEEKKDDIGRKWKTWKYELKKRSFDSSSIIDEIVATQTDSRVEKQDFRKLVTRWFCEDAQTLKGLKREDVQLLRRFGIQFKGGFENAEPAGNANSCQRR